MKKYLAILLGAVFVLGFAASAFAIHAEIPAETQAVVSKGATQINIGGDLRFRGEMTQNTGDLNSDKADVRIAAYQDLLNQGPESGIQTYLIADRFYLDVVKSSTTPMIASNDDPFTISTAVFTQGPIIRRSAWGTMT